VRQQVVLNAVMALSGVADKKWGYGKLAVQKTSRVLLAV